MNRDTIHMLAIETGVCDKDLSSDGNLVTDYGNASAQIEIFAERIAQIEREECAKLCESLKYMILLPTKQFNAEEVCDAQKFTAKHLANSIRNRRK